MDTSVDNEFVEYLQKNIVTGMGVPATYADETNNVDFSRSLVMQNNPFVREIISLQHEASTFGTEIVRRIYKLEYMGTTPEEKKEAEEYTSNLRKQLNSSNDRKDTSQPIDLIESLEERRRSRIKGDVQILTLEQLEESTKSESKKEKDDDTSLMSQISLDYIELNLPVPQYLNISAIQEQIQNYTSQIEFVTNTIYGENTSDETLEKKKQEFKRKYTMSLVTNIDWDSIEKLVEQVENDELRADLEKKANSPTNDNGEEGNEDVGDLDF